MLIALSQYYLKYIISGSCGSECLKIIFMDKVFGNSLSVCATILKKQHFICELKKHTGSFICWGSKLIKSWSRHLRALTVNAGPPWIP